MLKIPQYAKLVLWPKLVCLRSIYLDLCDNCSKVQRKYILFPPENGLQLTNMKYRNISARLSTAVKCYLRPVSLHTVLHGVFCMRSTLKHSCFTSINMPRFGAEICFRLKVCALHLQLLSNFEDEWQCLPC